MGDFKRLSTKLRYGLSEAHANVASVLIIIYGTEAKFIMTKKSSHLRIHAGEIAFPGGKRDYGDPDLLHTALRETREEIGLHIRRDDIIGNLVPVRTLNSNFIILPYVCLLDDVVGIMHNNEVEQVLHIPAGEFLQTQQADTDPAHTKAGDMYRFRFKEHTVWGASARMLKQISDAVCDGQ